MQQKFLRGIPPLGSVLSCLNEVIRNEETEQAFKYICYTVHFSTLACNTQFILLATVFIIEVPILKFAHIFSGISCRLSFPAVMLAVIMFS